MASKKMQTLAMAWKIATGLDHNYYLALELMRNEGRRNILVRSMGPKGTGRRVNYAVMKVEQLVTVTMPTAESIAMTPYPGTPVDINFAGGVRVGQQIVGVSGFKNDQVDALVAGILSYKMRHGSVYLQHIGLSGDESVVKGVESRNAGVQSIIQHEGDSSPAAYYPQMRKGQALWHQKALQGAKGAWICVRAMDPIDFINFVAYVARVQAAPTQVQVGAYKMLAIRIEDQEIGQILLTAHIRDWTFT